MALKEILAILAPETGLQLTDASSRAYAINLVNRAAKTYYNSSDFKGSEREQILALDVQQHLVAFPSYIGKILFLRDYEWREPIELVDFRPRYARSYWYQNNPTSAFWSQWRELGTSATKKNILDGTTLRVRFKAPLASSCTVVITGATSTASRQVESLVFSAGDQEKTTDGVYIGLEPGGIRKLTLSQYDMEVYNSDDELLAEVPNGALKAPYKLVQAQDRGMNTGQLRLVECLFKYVYVPFVNDNDTFLGDDNFDEGLAFAAAAIYYGKQEGKETRSIGYQSEADRIMLAVNENARNKQSDILEVGPQSSYKVADDVSWDIWNPHQPGYGYWGTNTGL